MKVFEKHQVVSSTGLIVLIYGDPGIGKTTLANTAPNPLLLDFDRGAHRASLGKKTVQFDSWNDLVENESELSILINQSDSIIIDTAGTLLESMNNYLLDTQPSLAKNGIKLWGELKKMFNDFFQPLKKLNKNIIFIAHAKEKEEGDIRIKRPLIQGSSYDLLMQSSDLVGYYTSTGNKRLLTFDLSETITAKNCAGIKPILVSDIPSMHSQMEDIIVQTKQALIQRSEDHDSSISIVQQWEEIAKTVDPKSIYQMLTDAKIKKSEKTSVWAAIQQVMKTRGYEFNKENTIFELTKGEES